jgi:hypothetical protein
MGAHKQPAQSQKGDEMIKRIQSLIDSQVMWDDADQRPPKDSAGVMVISGFAEAFAHAEALDTTDRVHKAFGAEEQDWMSADR